MKNFLLFVLLLVAAGSAPPPRQVEVAVVESSLATGGAMIRQFAFDGDPDAYFVSD